MSSNINKQKNSKNSKQIDLIEEASRSTAQATSEKNIQSLELFGPDHEENSEAGNNTEEVKFSGSYGEYRFVKVDEGMQIIDTVANRDGEKFVRNENIARFVNSINIDFPSDTQIEIGIENPLPVNDTITTDVKGQLLNHSQPFCISQSQLLENDIDFQGNTLKILELSEVLGGTAVLAEGGDILFTPDKNNGNFMGFKYTVKDSAGNSAAKISRDGISRYKIINNERRSMDDSAESAVMQARVILKTPDQPKDSLFFDQWYLAAINVMPVWQNYTGKDIRIGQFETGSLYYRHPDLIDNIDADFLKKIEQHTSPIPQSFDTHPTQVAGIMVATANDQGIIGIAHKAKLDSYSLYEHCYNDIKELMQAMVDNDQNRIKDLSQKIKMGTLNVLMKMQQYDAVNHSWGEDAFLDPLPSEFLTKKLQALNTAAKYGRKGLGTAIIWASGNDGFGGANTNYSIYTNTRFSIVVNGIDQVDDVSTSQEGTTAFYRAGANVLVSAPASYITTTNFNNNGEQYSDSYKTIEKGTSFAAPIVSGITALILQANPRLGYRDVQAILAMTAKKVLPSPLLSYLESISVTPTSHWQTNGSKNWNGGGMHVSHYYGYGQVDALAAVRLAENWINKPQSEENVIHLPSKLQSGKLDAAIPNGKLGGISYKLSLPQDPHIQIESAEVRLRLTHNRPGDLVIKLVSPAGTESILVDRPGKDPTESDAKGFSKFGESNTLDYTFSSARLRGEFGQGDWTLQIIDVVEDSDDDRGTLHEWELNFYGRKYDNDDEYFYTDEYAQIADQLGRNVLHDKNGGIDTINVAAVNQTSQIDLYTGKALIAGKALTIQNPDQIENIVGGAYDDVVVGNAQDNIYIGGGGKDLITDKGGSDTYRFKRGDGADIIFEEKTVASDNNKIYFGPDILPNQLWFTRQDDDLYIQVIGTDDSLTIKKHYLSSLPLLDSLQFNDGTIIEAGHINILENAMAKLSPPPLGQTTMPENYRNILQSSAAGDFVSGQGENNTLYADDELVGTEGNDNIFGGLKKDTLKGKEGNDLLVGDGGNDELFGGMGNDNLWGGPGNDVMSGGEGSDTYLFRRGDGEDTILSTENLPDDVDILMLGEGITREEVQMVRSGDNLDIVIIDSTDRISIVDYYNPDKNTVKHIYLNNKEEIFSNANLKGADFSFKNLSGRDLSGANLEGANLEGANLVNVKLTKALLKGANLRGANLESSFLKDSKRALAEAGTILKGADLTGADLTNANFAWADLTDAVLEKTTLKNTNFQSANLIGANLASDDLKGGIFKYAKLSFVDFSRHDLTDVNLEAALLAGSNFTDATLKGANLNSAILVKANMMRCFLEGASLKEATLVEANLAEVNLSGLDLTRANLTDANLTKVNLANAQLVKAILVNTDLSEANLTGANLEGVSLSGTKLQRAILAGANLSKTTFSEIDLTGVNLSGVNLSGASFSSDVILKGVMLAGATLEGASLISADLTGADLQGAKLQGAKLDGANLERAKLAGADLANLNLDVNLKGADLTGASLKGCTLIDADLTGVNLTGANLEGVDFGISNLTGAIFTNANLKGANLGGAILKDADLRGVKLTEVDLSEADLTSAILKDTDLMRPQQAEVEPVESKLKDAYMLVSHPQSPEINREFPSVEGLIHAMSALLPNTNNMAGYAAPLRSQLMSDANAFITSPAV